MELADYLTVELPGECGQDWEDRMILINRSAYQWLDDRIDNDTYADILAECGLDPIAHILPVQDLVLRL